MKPTAYNPASELRLLAAQMRPAPFVHPQDPKHQRGSDRRILCQDGHWHRITALQRDLRCEHDAISTVTE